MFNNRPSSDMPNQGKKVASQKKPDTFSIGWNVEETNANLNRKKDREPQIKLNTPGQAPNTQARRNQPQESIHHSQQQAPQQSNYQNQKPPQYNEEQVFQSLRKYERLEDMPQNELDQVLLYYEDMKQPEKKEVFEEGRYDPRQEGNNRYPSEEQIPSSNRITSEKREMIKPKDSLGGIISGESSNQIPSNTRSSNRNQSSFALGDGFNPFAKQAPKAVKKNEFQRMEEVIKNPGPQQQGYKISNIFG